MDLPHYDDTCLFNTCIEKKNSDLQLLGFVYHLYPNNNVINIYPMQNKRAEDEMRLEET